MNLIKVPTLMLLLVSIVVSCDDDSGPVEPPPPPRTIDTTTHEYGWDYFYLGDGLCEVKDIAALSDTDVWVVGMLYYRDSSGSLDVPYDAAHWDGKTWTPVQMRNPPSRTVQNGVFGVAHNKVWSASNRPSLWNGYNWKHYLTSDGYPASGGIDRVWAKGNDAYFTTGDVVVHYDGQTFEQLPTGAPPGGIIGIGGYFRGNIYCCGTFYTGVVYRLDGKQWTEIDSLSESRKWRRWGVYATDGFLGFTGGGATYIDTAHGDKLQKIPQRLQAGGLPDTTHFVLGRSIRGTSRKNVWMVGDWGYVLHYNGKSWHWYSELWMNGVDYWGVSATENTVFIAGTGADGRGVVLRGRRK